MSHPRGTARRCRRTQQGAVAVEAALLFGALLVPVVIGITKFGPILHEKQRVDMTEIPQMDAEGKKFWAENQSCQSLSNRIKDSFAASLMRTNADLFGSKSTVLNMMTTNVQSIPNTTAVYVTIGWDPVLLKRWAESTGNPGLASNLRSTSARIEEAWITSGSGNCRS